MRCSIKRKGFSSSDKEMIENFIKDNGEPKCVEETDKLKYCSHKGLTKSYQQRSPLTDETREPVNNIDAEDELYGCKAYVRKYLNGHVVKLYSYNNKFYTKHQLTKIMKRIEERERIIAKASKVVKNPEPRYKFINQHFSEEEFFKLLEEHGLSAFSDTCSFTNDQVGTVTIQQYKRLIVLNI